MLKITGSSISWTLATWRAGRSRDTEIQLSITQLQLHAIPNSGCPSVPATTLSLPPQPHPPLLSSSPAVPHFHPCFLLSCPSHPLTSCPPSLVPSTPSLIRDLALMVAALAYNQWFTKLYCKDLRLVGAGMGWGLEGKRGG